PIAALLPLPSFPTRRSSDLPDFELFGGTGPEDEAFALRHLDQPCNPNELPTLRARLWKMVREGRLEYAEIFLSVAAAREVLPCLDRKSTRLNSSHVKSSYAV